MAKLVCLFMALWHPATLAEVPQAACCRIKVAYPQQMYEGHMARMTCWGSGTVVKVEGRWGCVLTAKHLFYGKHAVPEQMKCSFDDGLNWWQMGWGAVSETDDLALAWVESPPAACKLADSADGLMTAAGFGDPQTEKFAGFTGALSDVYKTQSGQILFQMVGRARQGDSGGGVFNEAGELIGVISGNRTTDPKDGEPVKYLGAVFVGPARIAVFLAAHPHHQ